MRASGTLRSCLSSSKCIRLIFVGATFHFPSAVSFQPTCSAVRVRRTFRRANAPNAGASSAADAEDAAGAGLRFAGSATYTTRSAPLPRRGKTLDDFFSIDRHRDRLCCGSGNVIVGPVARPTPELLDRWSREAARMGAVRPTADDELLRLTLTTSFLVFTISAVATVGCKIRRAPSENSSRSPEYQFTLIEEEFSADGPPPLVWVFNQLTGADRPKKEMTEQTNHSLFRVKAVPVNEGKRIAFTAHLTTEINIRFAATLLSILPAAKEIIEEQGGKSLKKNMQRDVPPGVNKFRTAYIQWLRD